MGPTEAEVVWKPSWMEVMICSCPSVPGTGEGANLLFLQRQTGDFSRQLQPDPGLQYTRGNACINAISEMSYKVSTQHQAPL